MATSEAVLFSVRVNRHFHAGCPRIFDAFLQPNVARHFLFATPAGRMVVAATDVRIGGHFNFTDLRADGEVAHTGVYLELDRPHRLAFTLHVPKYSDDSSRVVIDLMPRGGGCDLTLTHQMHIRWQETAERTRRGWQAILEALATTLGAAPDAATAARVPAPAPQTSR